MAFYAVAVGFSAVYEVRASQSFVGAGGFDGPDPPGFDILMMPCPFCGVPGKLVKIDDYKGSREIIIFALTAKW